MAEAVYGLCALTSALCAVLLLRGHRRRGARLLLWSGLCFVGLALNNLLLFIDLVVVPATDLALPRRLLALAAMGMLLHGLLWEGRDR